MSAPTRVSVQDTHHLSLRCSQSVITVLEGGYMRYVSAQSRHDSGVCTCLGESGFCLSILVYLLGLIFVFSSSLAFISLSFISPCSYFYILLFRSLVRLASLSSLFSSIRARRRGMGCAPRWSCGALPGLAALGSVARRSSASPGSAPMRV